MSLSKKLTCKGALRQVFICLRGPEPHTPPPLHTVYVYTVYLFTRGGGGGGRRLEGGNSSQSWIENTNSSLLSIKL
jgi:hypothetical protein